MCVFVLLVLDFFYDLYDKGYSYLLLNIVRLVILVLCIVDNIDVS